MDIYDHIAETLGITPLSSKELLRIEYEYKHTLDNNPTAWRCNIAPSYKHPKGWKHSVKTIEKMKDGRMKRDFTPAHRAAISAANKGKSNGPKLRGSDNASAKPVLCIETNIRYGSIVECAKAHGLCVRTISNHCRGKIRNTNPSRKPKHTFRYA